MVLDDGELDRISHLLAELGAEFVLLRGNEIDTRFRLPRDLLITTATRAVWISELDDVPRWSDAPLWITIHNQDFLPFRERLRELGVHFLVHSAADPEALRLLVLYALYGGAEKRDRPRVPAGYEISYWVGTHSAHATLVELSTHGCRLVTAENPPSGAKIVIELPKGLARGRRIRLPAQVVRAVPAEGRPGRFSLAVAFEEMSHSTEAEIEAILEGRSIGTHVTALGDDVPEVTAEVESIPAQAEDGSDPERRTRRRESYGRKVTALIGEATRVLLGRDLSTGGMRIEPRDDLKIGSHIRLAIHGASREEPVIIPATVIRDDGDEGLALRFVGARDRIDAYLQRLLENRASVRSLAKEDDDGRVVVSRILPDDD